MVKKEALTMIGKIRDTCHLAAGRLRRAGMFIEFFLHTEAKRRERRGPRL
jgi:hypothetical protein